MPHTYASLKADYEAQLARMVVTKADAINKAATRLIYLYRAGRYSDVPTKTGIPVCWIAASFEREASSNFSCSPAQGDPWDRPSVHVPAGRGPFTSWEASALDAYDLDGLDKVGAQNWSWPLCCYYGELFNGFGYRSHDIPSPYLWGGTNIQQRGKYVRDGVFDPNVMDSQLGIIPIMKRMAELDPALQVGKPATEPTIPPPTPKKLPPKKPVAHPSSGPIIVGTGGLLYWLQDHWPLLLIVFVAALAALWYVNHQSPPPLSPKAIPPEIPPVTPPKG